MTRIVRALGAALGRQHAADRPDTYRYGRGIGPLPVSHRPRRGHHG